MHTLMHACTRTHACSQTHTQTHTHIHKDKHTHKQTHTHLGTHTNMSRGKHTQSSLFLSSPVQEITLMFLDASGTSPKGELHQELLKTYKV